MRIETIPIAHCQKFFLWYTSRCFKGLEPRNMTGGIDHEKIFQRERGDSDIQQRTFQRVVGYRFDFFLRSRQNFLKSFTLETLSKGDIDNEEILQRQCFGGEHGNFFLFIGSRFGTRLCNG